MAEDWPKIGFTIVPGNLFSRPDFHEDHRAKTSTRLIRSRTSFLSRHILGNADDFIRFPRRWTVICKPNSSRARRVPAWIPHIKVVQSVLRLSLDWWPIGGDRAPHKSEGTTETGNICS